MARKTDPVGAFSKALEKLSRLHEESPEELQPVIQAAINHAKQERVNLLLSDVSEAIADALEAGANAADFEVAFKHARDKILPARVKQRQEALAGAANGNAQGS